MARASLNLSLSLSDLKVTMWFFRDSLSFSLSLYLSLSLSLSDVKVTMGLFKDKCQGVDKKAHFFKCSVESKRDTFEYSYSVSSLEGSHRIDLHKSSIPTNRAVVPKSSCIRSVT